MHKPCLWQGSPSEIDGRCTIGQISIRNNTEKDGSGYNRIDDSQGIKSKVGGAITNGEYCSQETESSA